MPAHITTTPTATDHPEIESLKERLKTPLEAVFRALDLTDPTVSVLLADDDEIRRLNAEWRDLEEPTDVLSFPAHPPGELPDDPEHLGDIAISIDTAERIVESGEHHRRIAEQLDCEPGELQWNLGDEVAFLFVHGLLHLVGYDHRTLEDEQKMRAMESRLWDTMND